MKALNEKHHISLAMQWIFSLWRYCPVCGLFVLEQSYFWHSENRPQFIHTNCYCVGRWHLDQKGDLTV